MEGEIIKRMTWLQRLYLKRELREKCQSFHRLGYVAVDEKELWNYLATYRWKHHPISSLKARKEDISQIKPNDFFDYEQLIAQTTNFSFQNRQDIEDLL
ncbi:post-transcriptional regulator [Melissococcus plutonius]